MTDFAPPPPPTKAERAEARARKDDARDVGGDDVLQLQDRQARELAAERARSAPQYRHAMAALNIVWDSALKIASGEEVTAKEAADYKRALHELAKLAKD